MLSTSTPHAYSGPALLHVGFIKTGTTTLQETIFANAKIGFECVGGAEHRALLVNWLRAHNDYLFDAEQLRAEMETLEQPIRMKGLVPVWSEETLLGDPLVTDYCGPHVLGLLTQLELNTKILITIRKQESFALSGYREALRFGRYRLTDFIGTGDEDLSMRPILRPEFLDYDQVITAYHAAFGVENCCVLPLEMLQRTPDLYVEKLCDFMDLPKAEAPDQRPRNIGRGGAALMLARYLNAFYVVSPLTYSPSLTRRVVDKMLNITNRLAPAALGAKIERKWRAKIKTQYAGRYTESNRQTEKLTGLDLAGLGYQ